MAGRDHPRCPSLNARRRRPNGRRQRRCAFLPARAKPATCSHRWSRRRPVLAQTWIDGLLDTDLFAAQRKQAARTSLPEERIRAILSALDARGGKLTGVALAERLGVPLFRLGGIVSALRRILNVEGYDVLSVDDSSRDHRG